MATQRGTMNIVCNLSGLLGREAGPSRMTLAARAPFSTSAIVGAVQKKKAAPAAKKKSASVVRKTPKSADAGAVKRKGARSSGSGSSDPSALGLSRDSPFAQPKPDMSQLPEFLPEMITAKDVYGVVAWSKRTWDALQFQQFGLPKSLAKQFGSESRPRTLIRPLTLEVLDMLDNARSKPSSPSEANTILNAPTGYGISTLMLQAFSYALESSWLVIYLPKSLTFVDSSSPYAYSEKHQVYLQPELTKHILQRILSVNKDHLSKITSDDGPFTLDGRGGKIEKGANLATIIQQGLQNGTSPDALQTIFEITMRTIVQQRNIPVLLAADGAQGLFSKTLYRDPDYRQLESYELAVPRTLQASLRTNGTGSFGGIQLGRSLTAMSLSNTKWPIPDEMRAALPNLNADLHPYAKLNDEMLSIVKECQFNVWDMSNAVLTRKEAGALFDVARKEGRMWSTANDESFMSRLVESGGSVATFQRGLRGSLL